MNRDGFGKVEISEDFKVGLSGKGAKNGADRFVFVVQSDGSPSAGNPDAQPDETEKEDAGKEDFWPIHERLNDLTAGKGLGKLDAGEKLFPRMAPEVEVEEDKHVHSVTMVLEMVALEVVEVAKAAKAVRADTEEEARSLFSLTSTGRAVQ